MVKLSSSHFVAAPRHKVFSSLVDPAVWQRSVEGCERIVPTGEHAFDAHIKVNLPVLKGTYVVKIQLLNLADPRALDVQWEGKVRFGSVKGSAWIRLEDRADRTEVQCQGEAHFGGVLAPLRSRVNEATARAMVASFLAKVEAELARA